jgi:hypothetical protein
LADSDDKIFSNFNADEPSTINLLRIIATQKRREVHFRDNHPHMVADKIEFEAVPDKVCFPLIMFPPSFFFLIFSVDWRCEDRKECWRMKRRIVAVSFDRS